MDCAPQDLCADAECARFSLIVANEYLDALPVHQFSRRAGGEWREVMVDMKANSDRLQWRLSAGDTINSKAWLPVCVRRT
jgi:SAM-dependent MidA family methyltransferase